MTCVLIASQIQLETILESGKVFGKKNYNLIEKHDFFERLQVDDDWFCEVGVGLCELWLGQGNSCCNWADLVH